MNALHVWHVALLVFRKERLASGAHNKRKRWAVHVRLGGHKTLVLAEDMVGQVGEGGDNTSDDQPPPVLRSAVANEDLFGVLRDAHIQTGHAKGEKMWMRLKKTYNNISRELCNEFPKTCLACTKTRSKPHKPAAGHTPIQSVGFGSRGQVDLIDLQTAEHGGMKWLLTYCDHATKFACTTPLPNKQV